MIDTVFFCIFFRTLLFRKDPFLTLCTILHFTWAGGTLADVWHVTMTLSRVFTSAGPEIIRSFGATAIIKNQNFVIQMIISLQWTETVLCWLSLDFVWTFWAEQLTWRPRICSRSWAGKLTWASDTDIHPAESVLVLVISDICALIKYIIMKLVSNESSQCICKEES